MRLTEGLAWAARAVGDGARVTSSRPLKGGLTSAVHAVNVTDRSGARHPLVLRRWDLEAVPGGPANIELEARTLRALASTGIPAPELVAADPSNGALLMTRLGGRTQLSHPDEAIDEMASLLVRIHEVDAPGGFFETWVDRDRLTVPSDARRPEVWHRAIAFVRNTDGAMESNFLHRDYQHFNMLWARGHLSGIVDWTFSCRGPRAVDVGHCRLNLAIMCSPDTADAFLAAYEAESGRRVDPWWDVLEIVKYSEVWKRFIPRQVAGRAPVDTDGMTSRVEDTLDRALARA